MRKSLDERQARVVLLAAAAFCASVSFGCRGSIGDGSGGDGTAGGSAEAGETTPKDSEPSLREPAAAQCGKLEVGRSPLRRLTRDEYANTVRDLLHVDDGASVAAAIASDEKLGAFNANAATPITNLRVEQYASAAEDLTAEALTRLDELLAPCVVAVDGEDSCASAFIESFGRKAFRRPLRPEELDAYRPLYEMGNELGGFTLGLQAVIEAMLQSPNFLYHVELGDEESDTGELRALDAWQLASRLSYFLWSSMPDDALFADAESGDLLDPDRLASHAERMLEDPRAADTIASFHLQWLHIEDLATLEKDPDLYPQFDADLRGSLQTETTRFADYVIRRGGGSLDTMLKAPFSFLDGPLFELYGIERPASHDPLEPVDLDPKERAGILTHASLLAQNAHTNQTSPVHRGKFVRERLLCQTLPPPPANVNTTPPKPSPDVTTRERFAEHDANPDCSGCHRLMDPIGLGFEHYDAIGAYRTKEANQPIDATGEIVATNDADGAFDGAIDLANMLAGSDQVRECVARQWFRFALRRIEGPSDACSIAQTFESFVGSDFNIRDLMLAVATTDAFRYRRMTPTAEETP